jgi:predicted permease
MNLISQTDTKGLNTFVGSFSLPALIFLSLAELDLSSVNWLFLLSVLVAKTVVFLVVVAVTLLVSRPINTGRAGLFAIFCTQSNDFAIGYPIGKYGRFALRVTDSAIVTDKKLENWGSLPNRIRDVLLFLCIQSL